MSRIADRQPVVDRLLASREALLRDAAPSLASAEALAALADEAVCALAETDAEPPGSWAVVALGGYGAGRLLPQSDLDLLIVSDAPAGRVKPFAEAVFYPLWDSGLQVGHQVRSRKEQLRACANDLATLTASLTARFVAGDRDLAERLLREIAARARRDRKRVLRELAERPRPGSPWLLEPDLKEGCGGRRDLDELTWTAAVLSGEPRRDPSALAALGLLEPATLELLREASAAVAAARWSLHVGAPRRREVLSLEAADDLPLPAESLTRALADTSFALTAVRRRVAGAPAPALPSTTEALLGELDRGEQALPLVEEAAYEGALERLLPGLRELMWTRRPGLSHALTVGAHCLATAALIADAPARDAFAAAALAALPDRRPLLAAALTHDFGKRQPGPDHARRGEAHARAAACALGAEQGADDAAVLVREHLLLAEASWRSDPYDEDGLLRLAGLVGRRELVGPLYVLTMADTLATAAGSWTPWRAALIREIAAGLDAALSADVAGAGIATAADRTRADALAELSASAAAERSFVELAPLRYLASTPPSEVVSHARLAAPVTAVADPSACALAVTAGPLASTWRVTVAARDRHGLFALLAGVFTLAGLSILGAQALAGPRDTAIDVFTVAPATLAPVDTSVWAGLERMLRAALADRFDVAGRLAERLRHYPPPPVRATADVTWHRASLSAAVLVRASDRVGLLHDLAEVLADEGLDIVAATVVTREDLATDTFHVIDREGRAPHDVSLLDRVAERLRRVARSPAS